MVPPVWLWVASRWLHIVAVALWLGGTLFLAAVLVPVARSQLEPSQRVELIERAARRFSRITWMAFAILTGTGVLNLWTRGFRLEDFATRQGAILIAKLSLFMAVLALSAVHDFWLGPRSVQAARAFGDGSAAYSRVRRLTVLLARLNLMIGLAIAVLAVALRI